MFARVVGRRHRPWFTTLLVVAGIGLLGAVRTLGWDRALLAALVTGALGAIVGLAWIDDRPVRHPVAWGAALAVVVGLGLPGLVLALGAWAVPVAALLALTSPWAIRAKDAAWSSTLRATRQPTREALRSDALLREWEASTRELTHARTPRESAEIVEIRGGILDDLLRRGDGRIPEFVWWSVDRDRTPPDRPGRS